MPEMEPRDFEDLADLRTFRNVCGEVANHVLYMVPVEETEAKLTFELRYQRDVPRPETRTVIPVRKG